MRSMIDTLPNNVELFENSPLLNWKKEGNLISCKFEYGKVKQKPYFCNKWFFKISRN